MIYLILVAGGLIWSLLQVWPGLTAEDRKTLPEAAQVMLFGRPLIRDWETLLLSAVGLAGALGATVHTLRSFYWYVGNRNLRLSWIPLYLLRPLVGAALAIVFFLIIRGGFFSPGTDTSQAVSPLAFVALAGLVGMFSEQAVLKLKEIAETIFVGAGKGEDAKPQETEEE
jgi:hypothetical protein